MKTETAMMELLNMLQVQNPLRNQMLEKEKQQIVDAYKQGLHDWSVADLSTSTICRVSESYYTETYEETQMK